jgi:hypothetical protein
MAKVPRLLPQFVPIQIGAQVWLNFFGRVIKIHRQAVPEISAVDNSITRKMGGGGLGARHIETHHGDAQGQNLGPQRYKSSTICRSA